MSSSSFLVHSQSSVEFRQFFRTNFIKLLLYSYTVYGFLFKKTFVIFDKLTDNFDNFKVQAEVCVV